jgi:hypothetical protein
MPTRAPSVKIAAAFAQERDASYAVRLIASVSAVDVRYTLRRVLSETGDMQMVVLEATFPDPAMASHVESAMTGAHGVLIPVDVLEDKASRAS